MSRTLTVVLIIALIAGGLMAIVGLVKMLNDRGDRWPVVFLAGMGLVFAARTVSFVTGSN